MAKIACSGRLRSPSLWRRANRSLGKPLSRFPRTRTAAYFLIVSSDDPDRFIEPNLEGNNRSSQVVTITLSPYADLAVTRVMAPALAIGDPARITVGWTVQNRGEAAGRTPNWEDAIIASTDRIVGNGDDRLLASFPRTGGLAPNATYSRNESVLLPPSFTGHFFLFVRTDADAGVFEGSLEANNSLFADQPVDIMPIPYADLIVESVESQAGASSGKPLTVAWSCVMTELDLPVWATGAITFTFRVIHSATIQFPVRTERSNTSVTWRRATVTNGSARSISPMAFPEPRTPSSRPHHFQKCLSSSREETIDECPRRLRSPSAPLPI